VDAKRGVVRGRISIGALALAGTYFLAPKLSKFISAYQLANVTVINGPYDTLLPKLRAGYLDFLVGLLKNPAPVDDVIEEELLPDPYVIAVLQDHPLANKKRVTRADLVSFDWILAPSGAWRRIIFENTFPGLSRPHSNIETHSLPTIASMLANTDRMTILTQSEVRVAHQPGQSLRALNFAPIEPSTAIGVTIRKDWHPSYIQRLFLEFLREQSLRQAAE
jgi:LysR family transcriptional regulator, regulator for genes of the gallate degradation pathway